jgi:hypothetical protein
MEGGSEDRDLVHPEVSSTPKTETDVYIAPDVYIEPVIQKIGASSIAQIERLIGELQQAKNLLASERERIERETARYIKFAQMASNSVKLISNTLPGSVRGGTRRDWRSSMSPVWPISR